MRLPGFRGKTPSDSVEFAAAQRTYQVTSDRQLISVAAGKPLLCQGIDPPIERRVLLSYEAQTEANRLVALKFLGHWVGDIHQPLHVSFLDDRGGNEVKVGGQCSGNLHATWDTCLVLYALGPDVSEAVADLLEIITPELKAEWAASDPRDWANEAFAISESAKTGYCVMHELSCDPSGQFVTIGTEYLDANAPVVKRQLLKAGVRLAHLLDMALLEKDGNRTPAP
jgi:hypothetical protein